MTRTVNGTGQVGRRVGLAACGNITLGSFLLVALLIDTSNCSRAWLLILPAIMVGILEFYPATSSLSILTNPQG